MLRPNDRARVEAIAESDDPTITPRDRLEAIKLLHSTGDTVAEAAHVTITQDVLSLVDADLEEHLGNYFAPLLSRSSDLPPVKMWRPTVEAEVTRRAEELAEPLARQMFNRFVREGVDAAEHHAQRSEQDAGGPAPPEGSPASPQDAKRREQDAQVRRQYSRDAPPGLTPEDLARQWPSAHRKWPPW